ncbi:MAG: hypothetical protein KF745_01235 [Phycisphaeraceae bacterium]|nr:hypothetical protein [Phycisphaeraceae bacterium]
MRIVGEAEEGDGGHAGLGDVGAGDGAAAVIEDRGVEGAGDAMEREDGVGADVGERGHVVPPGCV